MQIHVVHPGETLWLIAQRYGLTVNQIVTANQLESPSKLVSGLALVVPTPPQTHRVQPGENLTKIAHRYGTTIKEISEDESNSKSQSDYIRDYFNHPRP